MCAVKLLMFPQSDDLFDALHIGKDMQITKLYPQVMNGIRESSHTWAIVHTLLHWKPYQQFFTTMTKNITPQFKGALDVTDLL